MLDDLLKAKKKLEGSFGYPTHGSILLMNEATLQRLLVSLVEALTPGQAATRKRLMEESRPVEEAYFSDYNVWQAEALTHLIDVPDDQRDPRFEGKQQEIDPVWYADHPAPKWPERVYNDYEWLTRLYGLTIFVTASVPDGSVTKIDQPPPPRFDYIPYTEEELLAGMSYNRKEEKEVDNGDA